MAFTSDMILQRLLDETAKSNDHLTAMKQLLTGIDKSSSKKDQKDSKKDPKGKKDDTLEKTFGKMLSGPLKNISSTILGNDNSIQNTVKSVGTGIGAFGDAISKLPGPVGAAGTALNLVAQAGLAVYDYMNQQLDMYNKLNSSGLNLSEGMMSVSKGSANSFTSINDFSAMLSRNSDALAAMDSQYGDGVQQFGNLMNSIQLAQNASGLYGLSQQQLADVTAKNFKFTKMFGSQQQLQAGNQASSTEKFISTLNYLSKSVGKSVDELLGKFDSMSNNLDTTNMVFSLQERFNKTEEQATAMGKTYNSIFASMGEAGQVLQGLNSNKLTLYSLPEEYNNNFTQMYTDMLVSLQASGETNEKVIRQKMSKFVKDNSVLLEREIKAQNAAGNQVAAGWLSQLRNTEKLVNDPKTSPTPQFENLTNRFNLWIGTTFTKPFNDFFNKTKENVAGYLTSVADNSDSAWDFTKTVVSDAYNLLNEKLGGLLHLPIDMIEGAMTVLFGNDAAKNIETKFLGFFESVANIPLQLALSLQSWFSGSELGASMEGFKGAVKHTVSAFGDYVTSILNVKMDFEGVKERMAKAFSDMKEKLFGWFDKVTSWWNDESTDTNRTSSEPKRTTQSPAQVKSSDPKKSGTNTVTAAPEYTPPEKIEDSTEQAKQQPEDTSSLLANQTNESILKVLSQILNTLEGQASLESQSLTLIRQVVDNTEPPRNV